MFALGMCMCLLPEWNMFTQGVVTSIIGFIILLCIIPIYRKEHPKKTHGPVNWGIVLAFVIGIVGSLIMGYGMSKVMIEGATKSDMLVGIITGIVGLIICVLNYPVYSYIKSNKE